MRVYILECNWRAIIKFWWSSMSFFRGNLCIPSDPSEIREVGAEEKLPLWEKNRASRISEVNHVQCTSNALTMLWMTESECARENERERKRGGGEREPENVFVKTKSRNYEESSIRVWTMCIRKVKRKWRSIRGQRFPRAVSAGDSENFAFFSNPVDSTGKVTTNATNNVVIVCK